MTVRASSVLVRSLLLPVVALAGCSDDAVGGSGESGGIESLGHDSSGSGSTTIVDASSSGGDSTGGELPSCENGAHDEDESDVDCGGACPPCGPGGTCNDPADCDTMICGGGFCQTPTCYDDMQNGSEEGIDCGGTCPNACVNAGCTTNAQCGDGYFCLDRMCSPSSCKNMVEDTQESDVDCGGPDCPDCEPGQSCNADADCSTQVCGADDLCAQASCSDGAWNGDETDQDCGGPCPPCATGGNCMTGADCAEGVCSGGLCVDDSCDDAVWNGEETDEDCGGPECPDCADGQMCDSANDCIDDVCMGGLCIGPDCTDMVLNGDETDVDCGGSCGPTCIPGQDCDSSGDCVQGVCEFGACSTPDCGDGVENGNETDIDCGGSCGATCIPGEACDDAGDCVQGVCTAGVCAVPSCIDGVDNGTETDVDCGGPCGPTCIPGEGCVSGADCTESVCILSTCQAPTCTDGVQNGTEMGTDCAGTCVQPCPFGGELTVNTTLPDFQVQPAVDAAPNGGFTAVAWSSVPVASPPQDGNGAGVYLRVYNGFGTPVTGEVLVNVTTNGSQSFPALAAYNNGFVVAWQGPDGDGNGIFARRFDSLGTPLGGEIVVPSAITYEQRRPSVAIENGGAFVVCWEYNPASFDIRCRRFSAAGASVGGEIAINSTTIDQQNLPVVGMDNAGAFVVAWQSSGQDGDLVGVYMRRYDSAGVALGGETLVNQVTALSQQGPAIAMNGAGEYVIAWSSDAQDGSATGIYARSFSPAGLPLTPEFLVNTTTLGAQNNPAVAINADGDYVIAWQTADDGVLTGVFAKRYAQNNNVFGGEFLVNPTVFGLQEEPDVAVLGTDDIVGVWSEGDVAFTDRNIRLQRYQAQFP